MTTFGISSGPGALYGLSLLALRSILSLLMGLNSSTDEGYLKPCSIPVLSGGGGKNALQRASLFSVLELTILTIPFCCLTCNAGILVLPPSVGSPAAYRLATHTSFPVTSSSQPFQ